MSSRIQNLLIILGLIAVAALGYYLYTQQQASELLVESSLISSEAAAESAELLRRLNEVKQIELDTSVLSDPRFLLLTNNETPVIPDNIGRPNPFLEP